MPAFDIVGVSFSAVDTSVQLLKWLITNTQRFNGNPDKLKNALKHLNSILENIERYPSLTNPSFYPPKAWEILLRKFKKINKNLDQVKGKIQRRQSVSAKVLAWFNSSEHHELLKEIQAELNQLEYHVHQWGMISDYFESNSARLNYIIEYIHHELTLPNQQHGRLLHSLHDKFSAFFASYNGAVSEHDPVDDNESRTERNIQGLPNCLDTLMKYISTSGVSKEDRIKISNHITKVRWPWDIPSDEIEYELSPRGFRCKVSSGSCAHVYKANRIVNSTGRKIPVAVKELQIPEKELPERKSEVLREVFLQRDVVHKCVLQTHGVMWAHQSDGVQDGATSMRSVNDVMNDPSHYCPPCIVMERMDFNVAEACEGGILISQSDRIRVLLDVASALVHLHSRNVVHRDVKPANVLLHAPENELTGHAKLADFGVSRRVQRSVYARTYDTNGTLAYMPPEILSDMHNSSTRRSWDLWSFGALMCFLLSDLGWYVKNDAMSARQRATEGEIVREAELCANAIPNQKLKKIALKCLRANPFHRPSMAKIEASLRTVSVEEAPRSLERPNSLLPLIAEDAFQQRDINAIIDRFDDEKRNITYVTDPATYRSDSDSDEEESDTRTSSEFATVYETAISLLKGDGRRDRVHSAKKLLRSAADHGYLEARVELGLLYKSRERKLEKAVQEFGVASELGHPNAQYQLAMCYINGEGIEQDMNEAILLLSRASEKDHPEAIYELGCLCWSGYCVDKNRHDAIELFRKAADLGHERARLKYERLASYV